MNETVQMIKALTEADGVPGFEREVRELLQRYLEPLADELVRDRLGSVLGQKVGQADGPRVLLAGHLDEVGWMVTQITKHGFLRLQPLGGWWPHVMLAQRVKVKTRRGDFIGIIGSKAPHSLSPDDRNKVLAMKDLFIDIGATSRQEAEEWGVRPGDPITPVSEFITMRGGEYWAGKALDNRAGCALAVEALKRLQGESHPNIVYAGATVQEEIGLRGATTVANLVQPDIAIALDVGVAYDTPGYESGAGDTKLGDGPLVFIYDASMVPHVGLRDLVFDTAEELGLRVQVDALAGGGTDAGKFHLQGIGCPAVVIGFPVRYVHAHTAVMSSRDFQQATDLLHALLKKLDRHTVDALYER